MTLACDAADRNWVENELRAELDTAPATTRGAGWSDFLYLFGEPAAMAALLAEEGGDGRPPRVVVRDFIRRRISLPGWGRG